MAEREPDFNSLLKVKYNLHKSPEVESAVKKTEAKTKKSFSQDPMLRIQNYLERFSNILQRTEPEQRQQGINAIKELLHKDFVIKQGAVPDSYFDNQREMAREQGHGNIRITDFIKREQTKIIIEDQKSSLDSWVDYLSSKESSYMPIAFKYYVLRSVLSTGDYDNEKKRFTARSKGTVKPFLEFNAESLGFVFSVIKKQQEKEYGVLQQKSKTHKNALKKLETKKRSGESTNEEEVAQLQVLINEDESQRDKMFFGNRNHTDEEKKLFWEAFRDQDFPKLYAFALDMTKKIPKEKTSTAEGEWVKYHRYSDPEILLKSLQGKGTGWCTAGGEATAEAQLRSGDFYVYYSMDDNDQPTVPRAAIRMQGQQIAEVRGIAFQQNLEPEVIEIVEKKLKEFPDGPKYKKRVTDMRRLTEIENKLKAHKRLNTDDLLFLYEANTSIEGFGQARDPRIDEIRGKRSFSKDFDFLTGRKSLRFHPWFRKEQTLNLKHLSTIDEKLRKGEQLLGEDLAFIHELGGEKNKMFDFRQSQRIQELKEATNGIISGIPRNVNDDTRVFSGIINWESIRSIQEHSNIESVYRYKWETNRLFRNLEIGGKSGIELLKLLEENHIKISPFVKKLLKSGKFPTLPETTSMDLIRIDDEFGEIYSHTLTNSAIYEDASRYGLKLCPPEVAIYLRLAFKNQREEEDVYIASDGFPDGKGNLHYLVLCRRGDDLLITDWEDHSKFFSPLKFFFQIPKKT